MGKITNNEKTFRQVIIRKRRNIYIMLTNGIHFSMEPVPQSEVYQPYEINYCCLSPDNQTMVVYYGSPGDSKM